MISISTPEALIAQVLSGFDQRQRVQISGLSNADTQLLLLNLLAAEPEQINNFVLIFDQEKHITAWQSFADDLRSQEMVSAVSTLPFINCNGIDQYARHSYQLSQRLYSLNQLQQSSSSLVFTTTEALGQQTFTREALKSFCRELRVGQEIEMEELRQIFDDLGYFQSREVREYNSYALRGGIVDVFSPFYEHPLRIEFFGDEISSIRAFDVSNQSSSEELTHVLVGPTAEFVVPVAQRADAAQEIYETLLSSDIDRHDRDGMIRSFLGSGRFPGVESFSSILRDESEPAIAHLNSKSCLIFIDTIGSCFENYISTRDKSVEDYQLSKNHKKIGIDPDTWMLEGAVLRDTCEKNSRVIEIGNPYEDPYALKVCYSYEHLWTHIQSKNSQDRFDSWVEVITSLMNSGKNIYVATSSVESIERVSHLLEHRGFQPLRSDELLPRLLQSSLKEPSQELIVGVASFGAPAILGNGLVIPEHSLLGVKKSRHKPTSKNLQNLLSSFKELKVGSLIVHIEHGIGRYIGLKNLEVAGRKSDYLLLEYSGGDKVYLPVDRLNMLQRYHADGDKKSALDKLTGHGWEKRKSRVKKAVKDIADELLKLQAQRKLERGMSCRPLDDDYFRFETGFPYVETDDQLRVIQEVHKDMGSPYPMDRLVCGDVGFGKTEVALRAAYRAVLNGYQVLVLVPTTVLCYQHYETFQSRMKDFGIKVAQANRFVSSIEMKNAIKGLEEGHIDVLIGTHRILSKDINPRSLGLIVIDEEQRFGVVHKERLKSFKANCDILTMTATPIPRTLHMSLLGLRDISIITTPPAQRLPVKTYIAPFDESLIVDAIKLEVDRGGQVFFVHNRVEDIAAMRNFLVTLFPKVDIRVAHGQMPERDLEKVIIDFIAGKFSVMVCTTIIESGIDMPHVNTLIVNQADKFGLAQLYQIRGRVGRSPRQAYAYFLTPSSGKMSDDAKKRLDVLSVHQDLGSGFQIASHDLEIRGAGSLLGAEQSGQVADVGLELYTTMLEEAIKELQGQPVQHSVDTEVKIAFSERLPDEYISDESLRLQLYKKLFSIREREELHVIQGDTVDRFGALPDQALLLFKVAELKYLLRCCRAKKIQENRFDQIEIEFSSLSEPQIARIIATVKQRPEKYRLSPDYRLYLSLSVGFSADQKKQLTYVDELISLLEPLEVSMESSE